MRFLSIFQSVETGAPPSAEMQQKMGALIEKYMKAGHLLSTEGCLPTSLGARVRRQNGKLTVTDGPFTESKEVVGGFAIMQADTKEEMIRLTHEFLEVVGDGTCEIRQLYEMPAV